MLSLKFRPSRVATTAQNQDVIFTSDLSGKLWLARYRDGSFELVKFQLDVDQANSDMSLVIDSAENSPRALICFSHGFHKFWVHGSTLIKVLFFRLAPLRSNSEHVFESHYRLRCNESRSNISFI